jgi:hypothetical protein
MELPAPAALKDVYPAENILKRNLLIDAKYAIYAIAIILENA